ncbi:MULTISPECIES: TonB-dependent receptor domain-containing protein [Acinetobacter]|uniref:Putative ferric siderophore receptor protein n=1 Tax=Acinetobacter baylyi (strain ATCC 33305 / BD413 / ADP1) TaxID=62977 RepID=Q6FDB6_ACIAD|nr:MULTISPECIES: TonB-dependent receptor [Acinetobacter]ENV55476.1 hypothetical protein F952_00098 [Acinetobacter baylyi DSM 14961 = CIP 107474]KAF2370524.1 ferric siderophore receptor protein [Acinetobacter baylyi]KAF2373843.1 ferric siderophore receptor protein [Acinetobacter baylyi]KAF2377716.1 ferric siderophore receptor protein [Acinetobacter baylyi]KAF2382273.1 ferric siderophore receptor protein [Acinetobacter baylyi]
MSKRITRTALSLAILTSIFHATYAAEESKTPNNNVENTTKLQTIVVTAAGYEQNVKDAAASISVISRDDIEKKNATNVADLLTDIPGVDVRNGTGKTGNLEVEMRGMGAQYTLILIDGKRQNTNTDIAPNGFGSGLRSFLPPLASIERIEVIRGPMSTMYGSDAMGGVINIITKKVSNEWHGNLTVSGNVTESNKEANSLTTSFALNGPLVNDKLGIQLRGSYMDRGTADRVDESSNLRDPRPNKAHNYDVGAKLTYKLDNKNSFWIDGFTADQIYKNINNVLGTKDTDTTVNSYSQSGEMEYLRNQVSIGHDGDYDFGKWSTYVLQNNTQVKGRTLPSTYIPVELRGAERRLKNDDFLAHTDITSQLGMHKVTGGIEYQKSETTDTLRNQNPKLETESTAIFIEDEWRLFNPLAFTFGGRYEDHSGFGGHFSPRGYLVWTPSDTLTIKGGVSTGYKVPTAAQLYDGVTGVSVISYNGVSLGQGSGLTIGTPGLKPEESKNYELGVNFDNGENFEVSVTGYLNKIKNLISSDGYVYSCTFIDSPNRSGCITVAGASIYQDTFSQSMNANSAETKGVEVALKYKIIPEWDIKTAYTWADTEVTSGTNDGFAYTMLPKHAINTTSTWHINDAIDVYLQHEYKSSRKRFASVPTGTNATARNNLEIYNMTDNKFKAYNLFNLGTSYRYSDHMRINFAVNNLLDKDFTKIIGKTATSQTTVYEYIAMGSTNDGTYISGRNYWLSLSYDF